MPAFSRVTSITSARGNTELNRQLNKTLHNRDSNALSSADSLLSFLHSLLATAIATQQHEREAHVRETVRIVQLFDHRAIRKLLRVVREDERRREDYVNYLQHSRHQLLHVLAQLDEYQMRVERWELVGRRFIFQRVHFVRRVHDRTARAPTAGQTPAAYQQFPP